MTQKIKLRDICHARSGNKGNGVNVGLAVYDEKHYQWVKDHVSEDAVGQYLKAVTAGPIKRYELPLVGALNFLVPDVLEGGYSGSPILDTLGKCYSSILLDMEIESPPVV